MYTTTQEENTWKTQIMEKWQITISDQDKKTLNRAAEELENLLSKIRNQAIEEYCVSLIPSEATDLSSECD